jgi:hypothetical protein
MPSSFLKDPNAILDYKFDWSNWLGTGEIIASHTMTVDTGITNVSSSNDDDSVTIWLSGGTAGGRYNVTCRITTDTLPARVEDRTMRILAVQR